MLAENFVIEYLKENLISVTGSETTYDDLGEWEKSAYRNSVRFKILLRLKTIFDMNVYVSKNKLDGFRTTHVVIDDEYKTEIADCIKKISEMFTYIVRNFYLQKDGSFKNDYKVVLELFKSLNNQDSSDLQTHKLILDTYSKINNQHLLKETFEDDLNLELLLNDVVDIELSESFFSKKDDMLLEDLRGLKNYKKFAHMFSSIFENLRSKLFVTDDILGDLNETEQEFISFLLENIKTELIDDANNEKINTFYHLKKNEWEVLPKDIRERLISFIYKLANEENKMELNPRIDKNEEFDEIEEKHRTINKYIRMTNSTKLLKKLEDIKFKLEYPKVYRVIVELKNQQDFFMCSKFIENELSDEDWESYFVALQSLAETHSIISDKLIKADNTVLWAN